MLRKVITLSKAYSVNWTPDDVCNLLAINSITANKLVQFNKLNTNKLIREFYKLACRASLNSSVNENNKAAMLINYAKEIKELSNDYEVLFGRKIMSEAVPIAKHNDEEGEDSVINNIDRLQARLFYLTTQFSVHPCTHVAGHIVESLTQLCKHPHIELLPAQHYIYCQSLNYWRSRLINSPKSKSKVELH